MWKLSSDEGTEASSTFAANHDGAKNIVAKMAKCAVDNSIVKPYWCALPAGPEPAAEAPLKIAMEMIALKASLWHAHTKEGARVSQDLRIRPIQHA